ncbi:MAG: hypothetical protein R3190_16030, partial [Thermoanaerobaculia bacterium]|nr:hypothetical protein [Thermoanaerobaculia bacterium]
RPDAGRGRRLATGGGLVAIAVAVVLSLVVAARGGLEVRDRWAATHAARQHEPRADVIAIEGSAVVTPGRRLDLDLQITLAAPEAAGLDEVLLTLNPGLEVSRLEAGGTEAEWEQRDGLLTVRLPRPLAPAAETTIHLVASGAPDPLFAFLDSAKRLENGTMVDGQLAMLGTEAAIFARRYVALTPGIYWLPGAGAALPSAEPSRRPLDHSRLDLEVDVPAGWLVAGPGLREPVAGGSGDRYRFRPAAPVPEVGLIAARLERFATEIEGVEVELLLHRKHLANVELFADAADEIRDRAAEIFRDAARYGVPYPYRGLSLVEAPSQLRAYGGGWRMDSVQAMPGIMLIREHSFPTASFEFAFRNPERFEEQEGGLAAAKAEVLETFFENDFSGGNPFLGVSRNFLQYVTSASGEGATALDFVCQELVNQLLMDRGGFFSPYLFDFSMSTLIGETITEMISGQTDSVAQALLSAAADRPSVWDRALGVPLAAIEGFEEPKQAVNVLALKGRAIARSILDGLGREGTAALLAELRRRHAGGNFTAEDLTSIAADLGTPLTPIVGNWLHETSLPGFLTSPVTVARLDDDDQGRPRYQARLSVFNGETTPGVFRLRYATGEADKDADWHDSEPIRLGGGEAVEVGLLAGDPVRQLWLQPYLSLNRNDVRLDLPEVDEE